MTSGPPMRHARTRISSGTTQALKVFAMTLAVALVSVGCVAGIAVWQLTGNVGQGVHLALLPGQSAPLALTPESGHGLRGELDLSGL